FSNVARQLLARLAKAKDFVLSWPASHVVRQQNPLFSDVALLEQLSEAAIIMYPWQDDPDDGNNGDIHFGSGIPPHVVLLLTQRKLLHEFRQFATGYDGRMTDLINNIFDDRNVANGTISEHRIRTIINTTQEQFYDRLFQRLNNHQSTNLEATSQQNQSAQRGGFAPHYHHGKYWRLPANFGFPKGTARDLWRRWNVGDTVNNVPPLRCLKAKDFKFMDGVAGQRPARKVFNDMKSVCDFIDSLAKENGVDCCVEALSLAQCFDIFDKVATVDNGLSANSNRKAHTQWRTAIRNIQRIRQKSRNEAGLIAAPGQPAATAPAQDPPPAQAPTQTQAPTPAQAPTPTVATERNRPSTRRGRRPKRRHQALEEDTGDAFANAFPDTEPTEYQRRRETEIIAQVDEEEKEEQRNDEQRQLVETGLIVRQGVNNVGRPVGRCGVAGCNFPTLQLLHRCDFCNAFIHTVCAEAFSHALEDKWSCGCRSAHKT
nr:hypothetical protein [Spirochaetales bacterium]